MTNTELINKNQNDQAIPMWKIVLSQFVEHRLAVLGSICILFFTLIALLAPVIEKVTGLDPNSQNVAKRYLPPFSRSILSNGNRESLIDKFTLTNPDLAQKLQKEIHRLPQYSSFDEKDVLFELANLTPESSVEILKSISDSGPLINIIKNFESYHLFGTDELGRDVFIRLIYGTQISLGVGFLVALASALIGLIIGSIAGYYGGVIDSVLMRVTDALLSLPTLPVLIIVAAIDLNKVPLLNEIVGAQSESLIKVAFVLCVFSWMTVALLVRGSILSLKEREFILAAKTLGAKDSTIIIRHMFPNVIAPMLVSITLGVGESILFESALSFLGLGIQPPTPSWGNMLFNAQELIYQAPFLAVLPGLLILMVTISFNYLGDGLQDAIDPKAIRR